MVLYGFKISCFFREIVRTIFRVTKKAQKCVSFILTTLNMKVEEERMQI